MEHNLNVVFMGGKQAGCIGLLTLLAKKCNIIGAVGYDSIMNSMIDNFEIQRFNSIKSKDFIEKLKESDILVSVHGREIVSKELLEIPKYGCVNIHPCLYKYKGADPIGRLLEDKNTKASVGAHYMREKIDDGPLIYEWFVDVTGLSTRVEIYNALYPYYSVVLIEVIQMYNLLVQLDER